MVLRATIRVNSDENHSKEQAKANGKGPAYGGPRAATAALPCLSDINCSLGLNTDEESKSEKLKSSAYKTVWGLRQNIKEWSE